MSIFPCVSRPATLCNACKRGTPLTTRAARQLTQLRPKNCRAESSIRDSAPSSGAQLCSKRQQWLWEKTFVDALVRASVCRDCRITKPAAWNFRTPIENSRRMCTGHPRWETKRSISSPARREQRVLSATLPVPPIEAKSGLRRIAQHIPDETQNLVVDNENVPEQYKNMARAVDTLSTMAETSTKRQHFPLASRLVYTPEQEARAEPRRVLPPVDEYHRRELRKFSRRLRRPLGKTSPDKLWERYLSLQTPRLRYIHDHQIMYLFRHLSWVEVKNARSGKRYLAFLEECLGERIPLDIEHWNGAISFAGKQANNITTDEVRRAVEIWMRMEEQGVKADHVTFNILFDIAIKAGRFALADTIYQELKLRGMPLSRYLRSSLILYAGLRGDGDGVRKAFRDLVNAGEIVDTAIMNTVILSLIRAGEPSAAQGVFTRMKALSQTRFAAKSPNDWHERKKLTIRLNKVAKHLRREREEHEATFFGSPFSSDERRDEIQITSPIAPDAWTYGLLIKWNSQTSGDLARVCELLDEMRQRDLFITNAVYNIIFRGFMHHGIHANSAWSLASLEDFWTQFLASAKGDSPQQAPDADQDTQETKTSAVYDSHEANIEAFLKDEHDYDTEVAIQDDNVPEEQTEKDDYDESEEEEKDGDEREYISRERRAPHFTRSTCSAIIQAFLKCSGHARALEIWTVIQENWENMTLDEHQYVQNLLNHHHHHHHHLQRLSIQHPITENAMNSR